MAIRISSSHFSDEIRKMLNDYGGEVAQRMRGCVLQVAKDTAKELRQTSPVGSSGDYAKNWAYKPYKVHDFISDYVVYNKKPTYRVAHLVEKGHAEPRAKRGKKYVDGKPHIKPAELKAMEKLEKELREELEAIK